MCIKCGCGKKKGEKGFGMGPMGGMRKAAKKVAKKIAKKK
jgi:hypothetical protein